LIKTVIFDLGKSSCPSSGARLRCRWGRIVPILWRRFRSAWPPPAWSRPSKWARSRLRSSPRASRRRWAWRWTTSGSASCGAASSCPRRSCPRACSRIAAPLPDAAVVEHRCHSLPWVRGRYPLLGHFDDYVLSYQVGAAKPDARIYQVAVERAACAPGSASSPTTSRQMSGGPPGRPGRRSVRERRPSRAGVKARGLEW